MRVGSLVAGKREVDGLDMFFIGRVKKHDRVGMTKRYSDSVNDTIKVWCWWTFKNIEISIPLIPIITTKKETIKYNCYSKDVWEIEATCF